MEREVVVALTGRFEFPQETKGGIEFCLATDIQHLLGYSEWRYFNTVTAKAKTACEVSGHSTPDRFVDVNEMVEIGPEGNDE